MSSLNNADADWIEGFRRSVYPRLHPFIKPFGGYAVGGVGYNQYVGKLDEDEEVIEEELDEKGQRNPIACLKSLDDGRVSEGSWVLLHDDFPALIEEGMQLHITLFVREDGKPGRELYAHYEDDWRVSPLAHLREKNFEVATGVELATEYFNEHTYFVL